MIGRAIFALLVAAAPITSAEYAGRRTALSAVMDDGVLLALGAPEPVEDYLSLNQASSFEYLTGIDEPNAALLMVKRGGQVAMTLFVETKDPAQEVWSGARMGPAGAARRTGLPSRPREELAQALDSVLGDSTTLSVVGTMTGSGTGLTPDAQYVQRLVEQHPTVRIVDAERLVERLRGTKSAAELALTARAIAITADAERAAFAVVAPGVNESQVQATIEYTFRSEGAERPSFATIVGSGPNATTLHYNANNRLMAAGDLVVVDIGASYRGYAGDVTRTLPVSGRYTPRQRQVYQIVRDAQAAAERQAKVGAAARLMNDSATAVLAAGLARLGLIESADATYECGVSADTTPPRLCPQYTLYYMHGLGHGIGLDVHDPDQFYFTGRIGPGSAFTIEPGLYVRAALPAIVPSSPRNQRMLAAIGPAVAKYANIGVRIEDDYIATADGVRWTSTAPREADEIEAAMHTATHAASRRRITTSPSSP